MKEIAAGVKRIKSKDKRSFVALVVLTAQNAFNDKAAQILLIILGASLAFYGKSADASSLEYFLGGLILAPYILFSPLAGWVADRFSKTRVIQWMIFLQMVALGLIYFSVIQRAIGIGIVGFSILAVQSTFMSPAKKGIIKEMVGSERIGVASGVVEVVTVLAICAGQICSGIWFTERMAIRSDPWDGAYMMTFIFALLSVPTMLLAMLLKYYPAPAGDRHSFKRSIWVEHFGQMKDLLGNSKLRLAALGIGFFWFFGGFVNLIAFQLGKELSRGDWHYGMELAYFIGSASFGMIIGGLLASLISRRSIELGLIALGGLAMIVACMCLYFTATDSVIFKCWLALAGAGGAFFLVPLNAHLQDQCEPEQRGRVLAGSNLVDCFAGLLAVLLQFGLTKIGVTVQQQFGIMGVVCFCFTIYALRIFPVHYVQYTILTVARAYYRMKTLHKNRLPEDGGVLVLANHVTYLDAFLLTATSNRPIRFLVAEHFMQGRGSMRCFLKAFGCVPISPTKAKRAIDKAVEAIDGGSVVCLFPEGQLTRTGAVNGFKRGAELIVKKAQCPVVPVYLDGLWGSIFSYERRKYLKKWPKSSDFGVTVAWGEALSPEEFSMLKLRRHLLALGKEAWAYRDPLQRPEAILKRKFSISSSSDARRQELLDLILQVRGWPRSEQRCVLSNAYQLLDSPIWHSGKAVAIEISSLTKHGIAEIVGVCLPIIAQQSVIVLAGNETFEEWQELQSKHQINAVVASASWMKQCVKAGGACVYLSADGESEGVMPLTVLNGEVIAMGIPQHLIEVKDGQRQVGWKEGSAGRLLAGFVPEDVGELSVDEDGFVFSEVV